ncbi:phosphoenolpyruvate carboxylase [Klebsiella pneumoniae]|uniref:Phosphoenolpyruvate carboxylase n=1 Tax=Klebsiella pneumoniae TaxID=573 RepID=A0A2X3F406_KLEPN|nr:phosphoenolpyruvate carboxylase [Klebsiella pneumoniae]
MIRFKYGLPEVTISSLSLYTSAILEANLLPPAGAESRMARHHGRAVRRVVQDVSRLRA